MRKFGFVIMFTLAILLFLVQTTQAFGIVAFHADFFEKKGTVVIDAGHGGEDGGAVAGNGTMEKEINLAVALELANYLKQNNFDVILTRDGDYSIGDSNLSTVAERKRSDMQERLRIVQGAGECVFISIHQNHFTESKYYGAQMFYSKNREESAVLAEAIRANIVSSLQPENTRQNKEADSNIFLLDNCEVPAVLVECGFLSNPEESEKLCTESYQKDMAAAIYNGLIDYLEAGESEVETSELANE